MTPLAPPLLAHTGAGATWQALLFVVTLGLTVMAVATRLGRFQVDEVDDLVLPLAGLAIVSSIAPVFSDVLSDVVGWFIPTAVAAVVVLAAHATGALSAAARRDGATLLLGVGAVVSILFGSAIGRFLHPPDPRAFLVDDVDVAIASVDGRAPVDGRVVADASPIEVVVEVSGGSVGAPEDADERLTDDPEELGFVVLFADGMLLEAASAATCSRTRPCTRLTYQLALPPAVASITAELRPSGGRAFATVVFDRVALDPAS